MDQDVNLDQKREALAMSLFHAEKAVPVFIQTDRCTKCNVELMMRNEESLMICPQCKRTSNYLPLSTDHVDVDYVAQDTHANHTKSTATGNIDSTNEDNSYPKEALFLKFLMQFSEKVPDPPTRVYETILKELSKVHIAHASKVQPTPIGTILRKTNLKDFAWMSLRIAMALKRHEGEPMPSFSDAKISRLLSRFRMLIEELKRVKTRSRKKCFNFRFLVRGFLIMEGDHATSELFENHKTRSVLRREDKRVERACERLQKDAEKNGFDWTFFRSI